MLKVITLLLASLFFACAATAQTRHALVVGIDSYDDVPDLQKARNDARAVADALVTSGFETTLVEDTDQLALLSALERFASGIQPGDEAVFYFAGHGVEIDGQNYLLPSDIISPDDGGSLIVQRRSLPVADVIATMQSRGARVSLLILDACRNNPFPDRGLRSLGASRGLARTEAPEGAYVLYSAGAGQTALDALSQHDADDNSVFTRTLLPHLTTPGTRLRDMVLHVRREVRDLASTVGHNQFPAVYDQLDGEFYFAGEAPEVEAPVQTAAATPDPCMRALPVWTNVQGSQNRAALEAFVATFGECPVLTLLAEAQIAALVQPEPTPEAVQPGVASPPPEPSAPSQAARLPVAATSTSPRRPEAVAETSPAPSQEAVVEEVAVPVGTPESRMFDAAVAVGTRRGWQRFFALYPDGDFRDRALVEQERINAEELAEASGETYEDGRSVAVTRDVAASFEASLGITRADAMALQRALNARGYDVGSVDGIIGTGTRAQIALFQSEVELPATGVATEATARALGVTLQRPETDPDAPVFTTIAQRYDPEHLALIETDPRLLSAVEVFRNTPIVYGFFEGRVYIAALVWGINHRPASIMAERAGGHLVSITSAAESDFVFDLIRHDLRLWRLNTQSTRTWGPWIGLYQPEGAREPRGGFVWTSGEPVSYTNFEPGQPNNYDGIEHYVAFAGGHPVRSEPRPVQTWDDAGEFRFNAFVMEID